MSQIIVVFRARAHEVDEDYLPTAMHMRHGKRSRS